MSRGYKRRKKMMSKPDWEHPRDKSNRVMGDFYESVIKDLELLREKYKNNPEFRAEVDKMNNKEIA